MPNYLTTKEVAELLRIKERKVYDLASSGALPCSRAMGKLLFAEQDVHAWLAGNRGETSAPERKTRPSIFLGSHDPLLDWALRESGCGIATYFDGSLDGLRRFSAGEGIATGLHVFDPDGGAWNTGAASAHCRGEDAVLVRWAKRMRGLIVSKDLERAVTGLADLDGLRLVSRQPDAGAQKLLDYLASEAGLDLGGPGLVARSEADAVLAVLEGKADVAFGLEALAAPQGLRCIPVIEEEFGLLAGRIAWFDPPWQAFWQFCQSGKFAERAAELKGYDVSGMGEVVLNGP